MPTTPDASEYLPLLKTQKNQALRWIADAGLDPHAFEVTVGQWGEIPCTRFSYKGSPYFLEVTTAGRSYGARYSPGRANLLDFRMGVSLFEALAEEFSAWLTYLQREVEEPDLWALIEGAPAMFWPFGDANDEEPLTQQEIENVSVGIERGRLYLVQSGVTGQQLQEANAKLDYLVEAAKHSSRFGWLSLAFGVLWNVAVAVAFSPDQARALFESVAGGVRNLLSGM